MARPLRIQYPGAFYHITCRGNERKSIFSDDNDHHRFLDLLVESLETYQVKLYSYILMPNHFHLLIQTRLANLSEFMRRFNICYTGWFNFRHGRCGHLYQGRYKSFLIDADNYLLAVSRYLHLNSVRVANFESEDFRVRWRYACEYLWSSLPGYVDERRRVDFITYEFILEIVGGRRAYRDFIIDGLKRGVKNPFDDVRCQAILGDDDFTAGVKSKHVGGGSLRDQPSYRELMVEAVDSKKIIDIAAKKMGIGTAVVTRRCVKGFGEARGIIAELLYRYSGLTEARIGQILGGIDYGGVHQLRRRLQKLMEYDLSVREKYRVIEGFVQELCSK